MSLRVLIVQSDLKSAQPLVDFFSERGDRVFQATHAAQACSLVEESRPGLVVLDLHLPSAAHSDILREVRKHSPDALLLFTASYPDPTSEALAKEKGAQVFLRHPFTRSAIADAVQSLERVRASSAVRAFRPDLPRWRVPVRVKIAFPFALLALLFALAAGYVVTQVVVDSLEERFANQLIASGKVTADGVVREESRLLKSWRTLAFTQGVTEATAAGDAERLRSLVLPFAINYQEEAVEILDGHGQSVLSLRHRPGGNVEDYEATRGENVSAQWGFVQKVLTRQVTNGNDKFAGLARAPWGDYVYIAGPLLDGEGRLVGALLIGKSLPTLVRQLREATLADITVYDSTGQPLASTLGAEKDPLPGEHTARLWQGPSDVSITRSLTEGSVNYSEIVGLFQTGDGSQLGLIGSSLPATYLVQTSTVTRYEILILVALGILLVIGLGVYLADRITHPLLRVVRASTEVAQGNLDVAVEPLGNDEVADLAHSFNYMVSGLREGSIYRDLLGRTVSPEVRERLRESIASGRVRLEGQDAIATVLMADIRGFTTLSEKAEPTTILKWLNEYFGELVPIIARNGGVVNKFDGDAVLAFFGILPARLSPQESAQRACQAALEMLQAIDSINHRRWDRGEPLFITGIGINTGPVTAGGLGTADRLSFTVIGDAVNTAQRLEELTRHFGESGAIISEHTCIALQEQRNTFHLEPLGAPVLRGKLEPLPTYRLHP